MATDVSHPLFARFAALIAASEVPAAPRILGTARKL
jgi:hypothetical protein